MKKILLALIAAACILPAAAQNKVGDVVKSGEQYFLYLAEFRSPEANDEFQRNLSVIQTQNAQLKRLKDQIAAANDEEHKLFLQATMKKLEGDYKANERIMGEAYGFAANRTYKQIYMRSNICIMLKKTEIAELSMDGKPLDPQKMSNKQNFSMYRFKVVDGAKENEQLQDKLAKLLSTQFELNKLRKQLSETKDPVAQKGVNEKVADAEKQIKAMDAEIRKTHGIPDGRDYAVEIANSRLYLLLTPEEVKQILEKSKKAKPAPAKK